MNLIEIPNYGGILVPMNAGVVKTFSLVLRSLVSVLRSLMSANQRQLMKLLSCQIMKQGLIATVLLCRLEKARVGTCSICW